jgi:cysteine-rich repeat protein
MRIGAEPLVDSIDRAHRSRVVHVMSRRWLLTASLTAHLAVPVALFAGGGWQIERVHAAPPQLDLRQPLRLPAPAPAGGPVAAVAPPLDPKLPAKVIPKVPVQPQVKPEQAVVAVTGGGAETTGTGTGDAADTGTCRDNCGVAPPAEPVCGNGALETGEQCDDGNAANGDGCSSTCRTEPRPARTALVAPNVLQGLRISGETEIRPSSTTASMMARDRATEVSGTVMVCIASDGRVASATMRVSTRYDDYDDKLLAAVRDWHYRPYMLDATPVPACSLVRFVYRIR